MSRNSRANKARQTVEQATPAVEQATPAVETPAIVGPKRSYTVRYNGHRDGVRDGSRGVMLKTGVHGAGEVYIAQPKNVFAGDTLPESAGVVTLHVSTVEVPGHTLHYGSTSAANGRHTYRIAGAGAAVVIHPASMPSCPEGAEPAMLVCSLALREAMPKSKAEKVTPAIVGAALRMDTPSGE